MLPSLEDISPKLADSKMFSTLDAASGFCQIPIDEEITFITPFGRYAFCRLLFGIFLPPLRYFSGGVEVIMDDILVHGRNIDEHDACLDTVIRIVNDSGLKLNPRKCVYRQTELMYFGHLIGGNGIKPNPDRVEALLKLSRPNNVSELRTVFGMFQYLGKFMYDMSSVMKPMIYLLKSDLIWSWDHTQQASFDKTIELLATTQTLSFYDSTTPTVVSADASSFGIGAVLMQLAEGVLKPIAFASRTLTTAEQRYAQI